MSQIELIAALHARMRERVGALQELLARKDIGDFDVANADARYEEMLAEVHWLRDLLDVAIRRERGRLWERALEHHKRRLADFQAVMDDNP